MYSPYIDDTGFKEFLTSRVKQMDRHDFLAYVVRRFDSDRPLFRTFWQNSTFLCCAQPSPKTPYPPGGIPHTARPRWATSTFYASHTSSGQLRYDSRNKRVNLLSPLRLSAPQPHSLAGVARSPLTRFVRSQITSEESSHTKDLRRIWLRRPNKASHGGRRYNRGLSLAGRRLAKVDIRKTMLPKPCEDYGLELLNLDMKASRPAKTRNCADATPEKVEKAPFLFLRRLRANIDALYSVDDLRVEVSTELTNWNNPSWEPVAHWRRMLACNCGRVQELERGHTGDLEVVDLLRNEVTSVRGYPPPSQSERLYNNEAWVHIGIAGTFVGERRARVAR
ncbi:hypothetical protein C8F04DRAFT_1176605 [Mycena alexandri]|uniref:Uncharacterized protein n=1 Tax=Mycena alexandri TaxID=1745969 RepID=A0AAD6X9T6_9AGAR|nr:hypothetical protein C8F04DRAFT_1176605 [Mycena alexandri]